MASKKSNRERMDQSRGTSFRKRLQKSLDELKWLYMELYDNEESLQAFLRMLEKYDRNRSRELKMLDRIREKKGSWYAAQDMLGMILYTDGFAGSLKGLLEHLDYLEECGVNLIHLMPLLDSPQEKSDGGYAVSDFRKVRPDLGTMADLARTASACHKRNMALCLDLVMNHTSEEHDWAVKAKKGDPAYQDCYFFYDTRDIPDQFERTMPQVFPQTAPGNFTWCEEAQKTVMTTFYPFQWDLNYRNPAVFEEMTANLLYLCNRGVDIIRLDAIPYIWKTPGTKCRNLKEVHSLVRILRLAVGIVCPGAVLLGEVVMEPKEVVPYFGAAGKPECDMLYNVTTMCTTWHTVATKDVRLLRDQLDKVFSLPKEHCFLNYLRCHDDIGWGLDYGFLSRLGQEEVPHKKFLNEYFCGRYPGSDARGELYNDDPRLGDARLCGTTASLSGIEAAEYEQNGEKLGRALQRDLMLHAFLFTLRGLPILYGGDEIGQLNDYSYHEDPKKKDDSRYLHRGRRSWEETERRFTKGSRQEQLFTGLKKLETIRKTYAVFSNDAECGTWDTGNDSVLGIRRRMADETLLAVFNFGECEAQISIPAESAPVDLMTRALSDGELLLPANGFCWVLL